MTTGGWIVMLLSVGGTTGFFVWCIRRVLGTPLLLFQISEHRLGSMTRKCLPRGSEWADFDG